ncbi:MAG TPA: 4Fe-4S dicluster domain-containing protein [Terriglobales bacterium]|nr:4Fe-4S dicluster domain-containing protein [Terriglobales bacterium]
MLGFTFDFGKCIGCKACQVACKDLHDLQKGVFLRRVDEVCGGYYSGACNHCKEPACVNICPTGAMYKTEDGLTLHDDARCIGCGACATACPYGAPALHPRYGVAVKCDACRDRLAPACVAACPVRALSFGELQDTCAKASFLPDPEPTGPSLYIKYD